MLDVRTLERRTGGRRCTDQPVLVAEHDLGIGADVHDEPVLILGMWLFCKKYGGCIGPDEASNGG
jgi:hypothetical protein